MFTTATRMKHSFAAKKKNIFLDQALMNNSVIALVGGVSLETGIEEYLIKVDFIDTNSFIQFINILVESNIGQKKALFINNASFDKSKIVNAYLKE